MKHIVLIDDNPSDRWVIKMALEEAGVKATIQELVDGEQALRFVRKAGEMMPVPDIDLVLLDLNLPCYNGQEILASVRSCFAEVPILVISSADPSQEQPKLAPYTPHYFRKPHELEEFLQIGKAVANLLDGKPLASRLREVGANGKI